MIKYFRIQVLKHPQNIAIYVYTPSPQARAHKLHWYAEMLLRLCLVLRLHTHQPANQISRCHPSGSLRPKSNITTSINQYINDITPNNKKTTTITSTNDNDYDNDDNDNDKGAGRRGERTKTKGEGEG